MRGLVDNTVVLTEALRGSPAPQDVLCRMRLIEVQHVDLAGLIRTGHLVTHEQIADEVAGIFAALLAIRFPIEQIVPISEFGWDDDASMAANNTSCFNYRLIAGTDRMSVHSHGRAVDVNPRWNPYGPDPATWLPPNGSYDLAQPGTIGRDTVDPAGREVIRLFEDAGWTWLGEHAVRDRHHFEKPA